MKRKTLRPLMIIISLLMLSPAVVMGQSIDELCRQFIQQAFQQLGSNCANVADEAACYGFGELRTTYYENGQPIILEPALLENLDETSDRTALLDNTSAGTVESYELPSFVLDREEPIESTWGIAVQQVRANLPVQLPQNDLVMILLGGTRVENAVFPDEAVVIGDIIEIVSYDTIDIYTTPENLGYQTRSVLVDTLSGGGTLEADAISPDGEWVRVFYRYERRFGERATGWVRVTQLTDTANITALPVFGPDDYTAMQYFYLSNELTAPPCEEVPPPGVIIQSPGQIETEFLLNEVPVRMNSAGHFQQISPLRLRVTTVDGVIILYYEEAEVVIPEGFSAIICLEPDQDLAIDGQPNDQPPDDDCADAGLEGPNQDILDILQTLEDLPDNIIDLPDVPEIICASSNGQVVCELPPGVIQRIRAWCENGRITDEEICSLVGVDISGDSAATGN